MKFASIVVLNCAVLVAGCGANAAETESTESSASAISADDLPSDFAALLRSERSLTDAQLDAFHRVEHDVVVAPGRTIHTIETFTLRAWLQWPHRAMLMIPGPVTNAAFYNIDAEGYDAGKILAARGYFVWSADLEGAGLSSHPVDGNVATLPRQVENMSAVARRIQLTRLVPRVDVFGESWGGSIAAEVCARASIARSCVMSSMIYRNASDVGNATFRSPEFHALLDSLPNGYLPTFPEFYFQFVAESPTAVQNYAFATQPGLYSVAPEYAVFDLPFFDPTRAVVPGLILRGELDPNQPLSDTQELAHDYGTHGARLVVVSGAGHVPRVAPAPASTAFWDTVIEFVEHPGHS